MRSGHRDVHQFLHGGELFKLGLPWPEGCRAASIGPVTTATLKELGHAPSITAKTHDINGLVEAIVKAAGK